MALRPFSFDRHLGFIIADNSRLWTTVIDLMRDPANALPETLRAAIVSVGLAVQREMQRDAPDFEFLIGVNEDIAAGLSTGGLWSDPHTRLLRVG